MKCSSTEQEVYTGSNIARCMIVDAAANVLQVLEVSGELTQRQHNHAKTRHSAFLMLTQGQKRALGREFSCITRFILFTNSSFPLQLTVNYANSSLFLSLQKTLSINLSIVVLYKVTAVALILYTAFALCRFMLQYQLLNTHSYSPLDRIPIMHVN